MGLSLNGNPANKTGWFYRHPSWCPCSRKRETLHEGCVRRWVTAGDRIPWWPKSRGKCLIFTTKTQKDWSHAGVSKKPPDWTTKERLNLQGLRYIFGCITVTKTEFNVPWSFLTNWPERAQNIHSGNFCPNNIHNSTKPHHIFLIDWEILLFGEKQPFVFPVCRAVSIHKMKLRAAQPRKKQLHVWKLHAVFSTKLQQFWKHFRAGPITQKHGTASKESADPGFCQEQFDLNFTLRVSPIGAPSISGLLLPLVCYPPSPQVLPCPQNPQWVPRPLMDIALPPWVLPLAYGCEVTGCPNIDQKAQLKNDQEKWSRSYISKTPFLRNHDARNRLYLRFVSIFKKSLHCRREPVCMRTMFFSFSPVNRSTWHSLWYFCKWDHMFFFSG